MRGDFFVGDWHVQPQIHRIQRGHISIHLEPKVMQVLALLASTPGELVTKERLLETVWSGVFVGDDVLTRAISELRRVLVDDARSPHIIQTIPKTGYRLIAPVSFEAEPPADTPSTPEAEEESPEAAAAPSPDQDSHPTTSVSAAPETALPGTSRIRITPTIFWSLAAALILTAALAAVFLFRLHRGNAPALYRTQPLTSYPGSQGQPTFSPDGNQVAFIWDQETNRNRSIYLKILGTANPVRLTSSDGDDASPAWSPDGRFIAFIRRQSGQVSLNLVPAIGGPERRIHVLSDNASWDYAGVSWASDGKQLIFPDRPSPQEPSSLYAISVDTLETRRLTTPPASWDGDWSPVVSPNGKKLAFVRGPESAVRDLYVMDVNAGEPRRLTSDGRLIVGLTWTPDGENIVFSSNRDGQFSLWQIKATGGTPMRLAAGGENAYSPAIARNGDRLAYTHGTGTWKLLRIDLKAPANAASEQTVLSSNEQDAAPQFSPDGAHIAFHSWRSGAQEIWLAGPDGSAPLQLTSTSGVLTANPDWSPDGKWIAFDSRPNGRAHIYLISAEGGVPRPLTTGQSNDIFPCWSADGKWIYFNSNRSGSWQIWKVSTSGGEPEQLTQHGGMTVRASADNQWIYYTKPGQAGLWRATVTGKGEQKVLDAPPDGFQGFFALSAQGIYYFAKENGAWSIDFVTFSSPEHPTRLRSIPADREPTPITGLSISADGRWLIYSSMTEANSNITLVENFR